MEHRGGDAIQVFVRLRPPGRPEADLDLGLCVTVDHDHRAVVLKAKPDPKVFTFDQVADVGTTQETVFSAVAKKLIDSCISGYNGTIFAYGQTGSGKTFTMVGPSEDDSSFQHELRGVIPRSFEYLFSLINRQKELLGDRIQFLCRASFLEIYNEQVSDLQDAGGNAPVIRENIKLGIIVEGLTETAVTTATDAYKVLQNGWKNRRVAETAMNTESSRSHAVFTLHIESKEHKQGTVQVRQSRLNLVDLAGSERQKDTKTTGSRLKEGCSINKSLSALGNVIMCLVHNSHDVKPRYVPYRDSRLTFLLRDSLGGNAKTHIIACIHPGTKFFGETLSTLQFAWRAKQIKNKAVVNEDLHGNVPALQAELRQLKADLAERDRVLAGLQQNTLAVSSSSGGGGGDPGPWKERFLESVCLYKSLKHKLQLLEQKHQLQEDQLANKEKKIMQTKMVLRFRSETIKQWEARHRGQNPPPAADDLILSLRDEIRALEDLKASKHEVRDLGTERTCLKREVEMLQAQLGLHQFGEPQLLAAYEEALAEKDMDRQTPVVASQDMKEPAVGTVERQKSQLAKLKEEIETLKRSHASDVESMKKTISDLETSLSNAQTARKELEKMLKLSHERCIIQRENQDQIHIDAIKTITTPKKAKYNLRTRLVMAPGSGPSTPSLSGTPEEPFTTPELTSVTTLHSPLAMLEMDAEDENMLQNEQMPSNLYAEQIEGLTTEIQSLRQENTALVAKIQDDDANRLVVAAEKSALVTKNSALEQRVVAFEDVAAQNTEVLSALQAELDCTKASYELSQGELLDMRVMLTQVDKQTQEMRIERDGLRTSNSSNESKVASLAYQLEESRRLCDNLTVSLTSAQEDAENGQSELEFLAAQQREVEVRLQAETGQHAQTRQYLQVVQDHLDKTTATVEQLKAQMQQQGSEKEQELVTVLGEKVALEEALVVGRTEVAALEQNLTTVRSELTTAQQQLAHQHRAQKDLEDAMSCVAIDRNNLRQLTKARESELADLQGQVADLRNHLELEAVLRITELQSVQDENAASVAAFDEQLLERENSLAQAKAHADLVQDDLEQLQFMNDELLTRNQNLEVERDASKIEISQLNDLKVKLSQQISELDTKVAQSKEAFSHQQAQYEKMLSERDALIPSEDVVARLQAEQADLHRSNLERGQDLAAARADVLTLSRQLGVMSQTQAKHRAEQEEEQRETETYRARCAEQVKEWQEMAAREQAMSDTLTKKVTNLELLLAQKDLDRAEMQRMINKNQEALVAARNLDWKVEEQTKQLNALKHDLEDKADQIDRLQKVTLNDQETMSAQSSKLAELQEVHRHTRTERDDLRVRLDQVHLEASLLAGHQNHQQKIHYMQKLKEENNVLLEEKSRMEKRINHLETKLKTLPQLTTPSKAGAGFTKGGTPSRAQGITPSRAQSITPSRAHGIMANAAQANSPSLKHAKENIEPSNL